MNLHIDSGYYGYRDEEDGVLLRVEAEAETAMRRAAIDEWEAEQKLRELESGGEYTRVKTSTDTETTRFAAHVTLPDDAHIEREVLNRKKRELLAKYKSDDLLAQEADAKKMLH